MISRTSHAESFGPEHRRPIHRRAIGLAVSVVAVGCLAAVPPDAGALVVSSDANGLQIREPDNILNRVKLSLVDAGGLKYRVEMAQFGGRGIGFGPGCSHASTQSGIDVALCDRIAPVVSQVTLGPFRDTFNVDPSFPDPIHVNDGGIGPDIFTLGAGNDISRADRLDTVLGQAGDDELTSTGGRIDGGEGNDKLHALSPTSGTMLGGPGDDTLTADPKAGSTMVGGDGTDSFDANGARGTIDARDGVSEQVSCGQGPAGRVGTAIIDLLDTPDDAALIAEGCLTVDRAPRGEKTAAQVVSRSLTLRRGTAGVKVRCTRGTRCGGKVSLTVKGRTSSKSYSIRGKRTSTIRLAARRGTATVRLSERGKQGPRTVRSTLKVQR
jgi:hypothetical protein